MAIHVSIHDVSPAFEADVSRAVRLCHERGIQPALLVVPDFHRRAPLARSPAFVRRLRALADRGSEIFLHGWCHRTERTAATVGWLLRQRLASAGEAEFGELDAAQAESRLDAGLSLFASLGLPVHGFVPPAWILPRRVVRALAAHGVRYAEDHLRVIDPVRGRARASLVLNFATRSRARLLGSVAYVRVARSLSSALPTRVAIHPADLHSPVTLRETVRLLDWASKRRVVRGAELLEPSPSSPP